MKGKERDAWRDGERKSEKEKGNEITYKLEIEREIKCG